MYISVEMQSNECFICGSNDFTVTDGAFICNECGIQSQTIREEQITLNDNIMTVMHDDMVDKDYKITTGSQLEKGKKLLSWECFNLILLGLTKEIIELGAKPSLQIIVLQLWVRYLQCIEAAFTSKKFKKIPKLNTAINNVDCEILYGVENIKSKILYAKTGIKIQPNKRRSNKRKSLKSNNSSTFSVLSTNQKRLRINQNLRKIEKSTTGLNNDSVWLSDDVSVLQRSIKSSKIKIKLTKDIKKSLRSMPSKTEDLTNEESSMLVKSSKKYWNKLKCKDKKNLLTIKKIISIIQLALMINNDDIYLSDILRWICEGHFPVNRVNLFLPENTVHGINFSYIVHNSSRTGLNVELAMLLNHLEVNQLPDIDFKTLVIRFCDELQLPDDFRHFVCKLILISPPNIKFTRILPDVEVKVMAYILFVAKFLFCLDGNAENLSSDFAEKINKSNKVNTKLFNWNDYVQFIECRNSIISQYNYLLHKRVYGNNIRNTQIFVNNWNIMKSTLPIVENEKLSKGFRDNTECLLKSLPDIEKKRSYREIPASTKPLSSTLKWIFEYYSTQLSVEAKIILENNFTQTDVLYLTDEKRIYDLAGECDIPIKVNCNKPLHYMKQKNKDPDTKYRKSYTDKTKVYLTNKPINKNETLKNSCEQEKPNTIFLGIGLNYWFIHINKKFFKETDITKVNTILKQKLPYSFLWFMNLCCEILYCPLSKIYLELMNLETELSTFLKTNETTSQKECEDMFSNITL